MGFNIGVWSEQATNNSDCYHFIERTFYDFVDSGRQYGDQSILIQSGRYYGHDLSPLLKLVYTWDGVTPDDIKANVQNTDDLLNLVTSFRNSVEQDLTVCDKISYVWYEQSVNMSEEEKETLIKEVGETMAKPFLDIIDQRRKEIEENPNPWRQYFDEGRILGDLDNLIKRLQCYKDKGVTEIYLTAG
jgi:hypothetical protein